MERATLKSDQLCKRRALQLTISFIFDVFSVHSYRVSLTDYTFCSIKLRLTHYSSYFFSLIDPKNVRWLCGKRECYVITDNVEQTIQMHSLALLNRIPLPVDETLNR